MLHVTRHMVLLRVVEVVFLIPRHRADVVKDGPSIPQGRGNRRGIPVQGLHHFWMWTLEVVVVSQLILSST